MLHSHWVSLQPLWTQGWGGQLGNAHRAGRSTGCLYREGQCGPGAYRLRAPSAWCLVHLWKSSAFSAILSRLYVLFSPEVLTAQCPQEASEADRLTPLWNKSSQGSLPRRVAPYTQRDPTACSSLGCSTDSLTEALRAVVTDEVSSPALYSPYLFFIKPSSKDKLSSVLLADQDSQVTPQPPSGKTSG